MIYHRRILEDWIETEACTLARVIHLKFIHNEETKKPVIWSREKEESKERERSEGET